MDFAAEYYSRFGSGAPALNSIGESCYEALTSFVSLVSRARSLRVDRMSAAAEQLVYESPRGVVAMRDHHMTQDIYIAEAKGLDFEVQDRIAAA